MSYMTIPPPADLIVSNEGIIENNVLTQTMGANTVYIYPFKVEAPTQYSGGRWRLGTAATGTSCVSIYTAAGNKVTGADTGAVANVTATTMIANFTTNPITLAPGNYFAAFSVSNGTDNISGKTTTAGIAIGAIRQATNTASGGVNPATLGTILTASGPVPGFSLVIVGGLV